MESKNPAEMKHIRVQNYDHGIWKREGLRIMKEGLLLTFSQNAMHKEKLLKISPQILYEASPYDTYWGSGLKINHPDCWDLTKWGDNNLGKLQMEVRQELT